MDGVGDAVLFALLPPSFKNRFSSDMDPCLACKVEALSSCRWNMVGCFLLSPCELTSTALRDERGR